MPDFMQKPVPIYHTTIEAVAGRIFVMAEASKKKLYRKERKARK